MNRWHCYLLMLLHQATVLAWILVAAVLGLLIWGFIMSPWIGIAMIGISSFLVVMAMSFVIMVYGFNSVTGVNMSEHTLSLNGEYISVEFEKGAPVEIKCADAKPYKIYPGGVLLPVGGPRAGWLWVPPSAFDNTEDFQKFLKGVFETRDTEKSSIDLK